MENFKWTDELVAEYARIRAIEYPMELRLGKTSIDEFKQSKQPKQPVQDYEILSVIDNDGGTWQQEIYNGEPHFCGNTYKYFFKTKIGRLFQIHSVKRLSDGEVFTLGDELTCGVILRFYLGWAGMEAHFTNGNGATLQTIQKVKPKLPLFTTEDGVEIFNDTSYWQVEVLPPTYKIFGASTLKEGNGSLHYNHNSIKKFSTKTAAEQYVLWNKPVLVNYKEIKSRFAEYGTYSYESVCSYLKEFFKTKQSSYK